MYTPQSIPDVYVSDEFGVIGSLLLTVKLCLTQRQDGIKMTGANYQGGTKNLFQYSHFLNCDTWFDWFTMFAVLGETKFLIVTSSEAPEDNLLIYLEVT